MGIPEDKPVPGGAAALNSHRGEFTWGRPVRSIEGVPCDGWLLPAFPGFARGPAEAPQEGAAGGGTIPGEGERSPLCWYYRIYRLKFLKEVRAASRRSRRGAARQALWKLWLRGRW